ncbi:MAG: hypothetical protein ACHQX3_05225, partial [Nitrospirales bacterium]
MVSKFAIAIVAGAVVMIALVLFPGFDQSPDRTRLDLEYSKQFLTRSVNGSLFASNAQLLVIGDDGSATYTNITGPSIEEKSFTIGSEELKSLRGLILETGFMQIPVNELPQQEGLANFTKYTIKAQGDTDAKTISWTESEFIDDSPALIKAIRDQLEAIISENGILQAQTMRFIDEVRQPNDVGLPEAVGGDKKRIADFKKKIK